MHKYYLHSIIAAGVGAAKSAGLTFIVGGSTDGYERAKPLLEKMGKNVIHCGVTGSGQVCAALVHALVVGSVMCCTLCTIWTGHMLTL